MAFLSFVRSGGKRYVYVTEYCGDQQHSSRKTTNIYKLGQQEEAFFTLQAWDLNFDYFPKTLREKGYCKKDLKKWIEDLKMSRKKIRM